MAILWDTVFEFVDSSSWTSCTSWLSPPSARHLQGMALGQHGPTNSPYCIPATETDLSWLISSIPNLSWHTWAAHSGQGLRLIPCYLTIPQFRTEINNSEYQQAAWKMTKTQYLWVQTTSNDDAENKYSHLGKYISRHAQRKCGVLQLF